MFLIYMNFCSNFNVWLIGKLGLRINHCIVSGILKN